MTTYNDELSQYVSDVFANEDDVLRRVRTQTKERGLPEIFIQPEEGRFLQILAGASGAQKALEIGTLGGYSGIWITRGLGTDGRLITLEKKPAHAEVAREHFALAGIDDRVEVRVGNAHQLLEKLREEAPFGFVFIDAEKSGYEDYYNWALAHIRAGGIVVAHNAFRGGRVLDEDDEAGAEIRRFNRLVARDERVISTIFPAGDGMVVATKVE